MSQIKSVLLWQNQRRYLRDALRAGTLQAAIVPTGSTEQHNEHLAMEHDTASALHIARLVAQGLFPQVVVTPPLAIGVSEHWMEHPGTLTLRPEVFGDVLYDVCGSLRRHGIQRILIVNGHAGNSRPIQARLESFREQLGIQLEACSYWEAYSRDLIAAQMESGTCPGHAAEFETSFALAAFPQNVDWPTADYDALPLHISDPRRAASDRTYHREARLATAEKGNVMIDAAVDWVTEKLRRMIESST